jgi:magnesium chelatase family protein
MDRIDLHVDVLRLPSSELRVAAPPGEPSVTVAARVAQARKRQLERTGKPNAQLSQAELRQTCALSDCDQGLLDAAADRLQLSARSVHRVLRVARTVADLDGTTAIQTQHLTEAIGYRRVDRGAAAL